MGDFINLVVSNTSYTLIVACVCIAIIFFVIKKMIKLIMYAFVLLIAFLAYLYYTGETVATTVETTQKAIEKGEQVVKENKVGQEIKKKIEKEIKK